MIKNILFDLDDTIFDFKKAERIALSNTLSELGVTPEDKILSRYSEINISQWKLLEKKIITRDEVKVRRYKLLFEEFNLDLSAEKTTALYEKKLAIGHYFIDGAEELLQGLYKSYRLYLVSNGASAVQHSRIAGSGIERYFKSIFISQEIGFDKPAKEFFDKCFSQIDGFSKSETIIVGDSLSSDIQGGINAGIKTVWFNPKCLKPDGIKPDYEIHLLKELEEILNYDLMR